jgi:hypothetical protein
VVAEFPTDLVELQHEVLKVEREYVERIGALYGHQLMRRARENGQLDAVSRELREAAKAA